MEHPKPAVIPAVGSKWRARDGREFEVIGSYPNGAGLSKPWATLKLLNPKPRQRRETNIELSYFGGDDGCHFLRPIS